MTIVLTVALGVALFIIGWRVRAIHRLTLQRLAGERPAGGPRAADVTPDGALRRWLVSAGYPAPEAPMFFAGLTAAAVVTGVVVALVTRAVVFPVLIATVAGVPGGVGETTAAILVAGPWFLLAVTALAPALVVRGVRRRRVQAVEHDLSLVLELFATLAQSGLSFDAALARVVDSDRQGRPLTTELQRFQRDMLAGVPRLSALRQMAQRLDVTAVSIFVAAVIQTEQIGASIAETLQHQADDLRARRREQALLSAQTLPVKLVLPLVVCFLPGIFLSTLGPVLYQMLEVADSVLRPVNR